MSGAKKNNIKNPIIPEMDITIKLDLYNFCPTLYAPKALYLATNFEAANGMLRLLLQLQYYMEHKHS